MLLHQKRTWKSKSKTRMGRATVKICRKSSHNLGLNAHATFSGSLLWQYFHPWPEGPVGLVEDGFAELKRWFPILNEFDNNGVDLCYEIHPGKIYLMKLMKCFCSKQSFEGCILYDPSSFCFAAIGLYSISIFIRENKSISC
jgi:hypothetical protein